MTRFFPRVPVHENQYKNTKQYTTAKQRLLDKGNTMVIPSVYRYTGTTDRRLVKVGFDMIASFAAIVASLQKKLSDP